MFETSGVPRPELNRSSRLKSSRWSLICCYLVGVASKLRTSILLGKGEFERDLFSPPESSFFTLSNFLFSTTGNGSASICTTGREVSNPTAMFLETAFTTVAGALGLAALAVVGGNVLETLGFFGGLSWISCCGFVRSSFRAVSASKLHLRRNMTFWTP